MMTTSDERTTAALEYLSDPVDGTTIDDYLPGQGGVSTAAPASSSAPSTRKWKPCKKCGSTKDADIQCSRCGGYGLVETMEGPDDCPYCGCSGVQYPPVCPDCCGYRAALAREDA